MRVAVYTGETSQRRRMVTATSITLNAKVGTMWGRQAYCRCKGALFDPNINE